MSVQLKPCPFCAGEAKIRSARCAEDAMDTWVECTSCGCSTDRVEDAYTDPATAAAIWNLRRDTSGNPLGALRKAESFIVGFEGDEHQDGIDDLLTDIRAAIANAEVRT